MKKISFLFLVSVFLVACKSYTSNGEKNYLQSRNGMLVVVPPQLTNENISHFYDLSSLHQDPLVSITPPSGV